MFLLLGADHPIPQDYVYRYEGLYPPRPDGRPAYRLTGDIVSFQCLKKDKELSFSTPLGIVGILVGAVIGGYVAAVLTAFAFGIRGRQRYTYRCMLTGNICFIAYSDERTYKEIRALYEKSIRDAAPS